MNTSWENNFIKRLLADALFHETELGTWSNLSLIDESTAKERFTASFLPEESAYIIERVTKWVPFFDRDFDDIAYAMASESVIYGTFDTAEEAATMLLNLARSHKLMPSLALLFEL